MRNLIRACAVLMLVACTTGAAWADGVDAKLFDPIPGPYGVISIHSSKATPHLSLYGSVTSHYGRDLYQFVAGPFAGSRPIAHRFATEVGVTLGLFNLAQVSASMPFYVRQFSQGYPVGSGRKGSSGPGDLRLLVKGTLLRNGKAGGFGIALIGEISAPTGTETELMGNTGITFTPRLVLDLRRGGFLLSLNAGLRIRKDNLSPVTGLEVGEELRFGLGAEVPLHYAGLSLLGEAVATIGFGALSGAKTSSENGHVSAEGIWGLRWRSWFGMMVTLGAGFGLSPGFGTSDFRVLLALGFGGGLGKRSFSLGGRGLYSSAQETGGPSTTAAAAAGTATGGTGTAGRSTGSAGKTATGKTATGDSGAPSGATPTRRVAAVKAVKPPPFRAHRKLKETAFDRATAADPDPDGDGIPAPRDRCPTKKEDIDGFQDDDGCPDPDNDQDGIPDVVDRCPLKPETINGVKDDDGCPDQGKTEVVLTRTHIKIRQRVFFATGSDQLKRRSYVILRQVALFLKAKFFIRKVLVEGHTDNMGDPEMNVDLAERRAQRVANFLVSRGVAAHRLLAKGYGSKRPLASNKTKAGKQKNRRVTFKVLQVVVHRAPGKKGGAK